MKRLICLALLLASMLAVAGCSLLPDPQTSAVADARAEVQAEVADATETFVNPDGTVSQENESAYLTAAYERIAQSKNENIADYGRDGEAIWVEFSDGHIMIIAPQITDTLSTPLENSCSIQTIEPSNYTFSPNSQEAITQKQDGAADLLAGMSTAWNHDTDTENEAVTLDTVNNLGSRKKGELILWVGHGSYTSKTGTVLWIGEKYDAIRARADTAYAKRFSNPGLVTNKDDYIGITAQYIEKNVKNLDGSLVYLGSCHSAEDTSLARAFQHAGASVVIGYSDTTMLAYHLDLMYAFAENLCVKDAYGYYTPADTAMAQAKQKVGAADSGRYRGIGSYAIVDQREEFRFTGTAPSSAGTNTDGGSDSSSASNSGSSGGTGLYATYLSIIEDYQREYGTHSVVHAKDEFFAIDYATGVAYAELIDFNHDGTEELALIVGDSAKIDPSVSHTGGDAYRLEVWALHDEFVDCVFTGTPVWGDSDYTSFPMYLANSASDPSVIVQGGGAPGYEENTFHAYDGDSFKVITTVRQDENDIYVDGQKISNGILDLPYYGAGYTHASVNVAEPVDGMYGTYENTFENGIFATTDATVAKLRGGGALSAPAQPTESTAAHAQTPAVDLSADYVLPDSSTRVYPRSELEQLSNEQLFFARNELFARHGCGFKNKDLRDFFGSKKWYRETVKAGSYDKTILTQTELENAETILAIEKERNSPYI